MSPIAQPLGSVLVVGGCGFLGHHIVRLLLEDPDCDSVAVLDIDVRRNRLSGVSYHQGDITSAETVHTILAEVQPRVVIHSAAPVPHQERPNRAIFTRVIIDGTANLLKCAAQSASVVAFLYTSTCAVLEGSEWTFADETYPLLKGRLNRDPYRETKAVADTLVLQANDRSGSNTEKTTGLRTACIRPGGIFGEGDYQVIPPILEALERGQVHVQMGSNTTRFDLVYVENVAHAHLLAAKALLAELTDPNAPKVDGEAFFITNDDPYRNWDFIWKVWAAAGYEATPDKMWVVSNDLALTIASVVDWVVWLTSCGRRRPKRLVRHMLEYGCVTKTFSIDKAKERLGYVPRVSIDEGIRKGVEWALRERALESAGQGKKE
ncbi:MAG: erg26, C-3 sterol dehydrogenase [Peltula sp. TS41687]|nr:MAG: erg26, C-3 sterol dehydrogenase [Peltula sp. TS41687]